MHPRKAIRHYVVDLLKTGVPPVQDRVFRSRAYPLRSQDLPGICVYTATNPSEASEEFSQDGLLLRDLPLAIDLYVRSGDEHPDAGPDDDLDDLAEAVEAAMKADRTLGGRALNSYLAETTIGFSGEGEQANGLARLRYAVQYRTL
jgi:hypothetical protein